MVDYLNGIESLQDGLHVGVKIFDEDLVQYLLAVSTLKEFIVFYFAG